MRAIARPHRLFVNATALDHLDPCLQSHLLVSTRDDPRFLQTE
jgi:hypothetical protein